MQEIEPVLVELLIQHSRMGAPLGQTKGLLLANSLIDGTVHQQKLIKWQTQTLGMNGRAELGRLRPSYWKLFRK